MADWTFATGDALTRKAWADKWWIEAKTESYFYGNGFVGKGQDNFILELPELENAQGDKITYGQVRELSGGGVAADGAMETNEEAPDIYDDDVTLTQIRNAVRTKGKLTEQLASEASGLRTWAKQLLKRWMGMTIDQAFFTDLAGSATKYLYGGDATATADIAAGDYMTLQLISKAVTYAAKATPLIVGKNIKGRETFACVMSPDQAFDLTERDGAWAQAQREAQQRGSDNPIFHRAMGIHKDCALHSHSRVALATTWGGGSVNGATAIFMGTQAGVIAYGKRKIWEEKTFDYGNKVGFCIGSIYGTSKSVFNSADNAVVCLRTMRTSN